MARLQQTFKTGKSVAEMRSFIDTRILKRPEIGLLLETHHWAGNVLHASGKLGSGTMVLEHGAVIIDIELTMFGAAAQGAIETQLRDQFKRLNED